MNHPHVLPENTAQTTENAFPFQGWELPEESPTVDAPPFEGKIIARMPDLGTEIFGKKVKKSLFSRLWEKISSSRTSAVQETVSPSPAVPSQFFYRFTAFGGIVLLCGVGFLLLERGEKSTEDTIDITQMVSESMPVPTTVFGNTAKVESAPTPDFLTVHETVLPVTPVENVAIVPPPADLPLQTESVWSRPASDSYSPWNSASRPPESPNAEAATTPASPPPVAPSPQTVAMTPMIDMSMAVSPYEQQWIAQSDSPAPPPVTPFIQAPIQQGYAPSYMSPQNYAPRPGTPTYPQYPPPSAVPGQTAPYGQAIPMNTPIPSGPSTLPTQGGYPGSGASPVPPSQYYNAPPTHRRVY
ncbi:MAG: hypothetical protein LBI05_05440 [Planctomycetaceae bacterium]|jgi:hypothetical protein|nr:hypothetical protein [Planctomycetaceae bacterium]